MLRCIYLSLFYFVASLSSAQTDELNQFWNQYDFARDISQNWVLQADAGFVSSSTPDDSNMFHGITQFYVRGWVHYYRFEKWKFSAFISNYSNKNVPELNQKKITGIQICPAGNL